MTAHRSHTYAAGVRQNSLPSEVCDGQLGKEMKNEPTGNVRLNVNIKQYRYYLIPLIHLGTYNLRFNM